LKTFPTPVADCQASWKLPMADLDPNRLHRYLTTVRENTEDLRSLLNQYEDEQILEDRYQLKALKYCLIEIAEAMADTL